MRKNILKGEICHIYLRGVDKQIIFKDEEDYVRFSNLLNYCNRSDSKQFSNFLKNGKKKVEKILKEKKEDYINTIIRTLMPNHFHLSIISLGDGFVGKYMQKVLDSYTKYFNSKYKRKGHLFEQKYDYRKINNDYDLHNTIDYIYNNPAKLLDKDYKHINLLNGEYHLTKEQKSFIKKYPYTFKGDVFKIYKEYFKLPY